MSASAQLLSELLSHKHQTSSPKLTRLDAFFDKAFGFCMTSGWIMLGIAVLGTLGALWLGILTGWLKSVLELIALLDLALWELMFLTLWAQMAAQLLVPKVRNAHEVRSFELNEAVARRIATYSEPVVQQVECWLKYRFEQIKVRIKFVVGGQVALTSLAAGLNSGALFGYIDRSAHLLSPVFHLPPERVVVGLLVGLGLLIASLLFVSWIGARYGRLLYLIDLSRSVPFGPESLPAPDSMPASSNRPAREAA